MRLRHDRYSLRRVMFHALAGLGASAMADWYAPERPVSSLVMCVITVMLLWRTVALFFDRDA